MSSFLVISLIGMSGCGKTYWAQKLAQQGLQFFCCDDLIEEKLSPQLKKLGFKGIADVAKWMGQPYEKKYKKRAATYLSCEKEVMQEILDNIKQGLAKNTIIDTTGSFIYTGEKICRQLKNYTKMVYLPIPKHIKNQMLEQYFKDPKPIIWGKIFNQKNKENNKKALCRCYPKLLNFRRKLYQRYADINLNYDTLRKKNLTVKNFINWVSRNSI